MDGICKKDFDTIPQVHVVIGTTHATLWIAWILFNWSEGSHMVPVHFL